MIKITPETLGREEMAWLWTALKADYRPTYPFQVSVVLMQPQRETTLALPVLQRRIRVQPTPPAQILQIRPPGRQPAAAPTAAVTVAGVFLAGLTQVSLSNPRYAIRHTAAAASVTGTSFSFVPDQSSAFPAGVYNVAAQSTEPTGMVVETINTLPLAIAPVLPTQTATVATTGTGNLVIVTFSPNVLKGQDVALALSALPPLPPFTSSASAQPFSGDNAASLGFQFPSFPSTVPAGSALLGRLTVDGVTSQVQVDWSAHPPKFTGPMVTI